MLSEKEMKKKHEELKGKLELEEDIESASEGESEDL